MRYKCAPSSVPRTGYDHRGDGGGFEALHNEGPYNPGRGGTGMTNEVFRKKRGVEVVGRYEEYLRKERVGKTRVLSQYKKPVCSGE